MALAALAAFAALVAAAIAIDSGPEAPVSVEAAIPPECAGDTPADVRRRLGQRIVVRMEGEATRELLSAARAGEIGGVVLFPPAGQDPAGLAREIERLQGAATETGGPPLLVAIDQEGGEVKRLPGLPPEMAPPQMAAQGTAAGQGRATGDALAELGINVDLAPVADVPAAPGSFIATRAFGTTPGQVAEAATAFAAGLQERGVAATAKHFPGLGRSSANTDLAQSEIAGGRDLLGTDLEPFEAAIAADVGLVMLANAVYPALDSKRPAFASAAVHALLRDELGFGGVTITDDLEAAAVRATYDRDEAALAAAAAGTDLLLFALTSRPGVLDSLAAAAERGRLGAEAIESSCVRVSDLRREYFSS